MMTMYLLQTDDGENLSVFGCRAGPVKFVVSETVLLLGLHKTGLRNIEGGGEGKPRPPCVGEDGIGGTEMPGKDIASDLLPVWGEIQTISFIYYFWNITTVYKFY